MILSVQASLCCRGTGEKEKESARGTMGRGKKEEKPLPYRVFSLTWPASMQIYRNKRRRLHKKRVQLPQDWFGTPTWPPFHCSGTPIWPPWRHVKTLYNYSFPYNVVYLNCVTYFISKLITRIWVKSYLQVELSVELRNSYVIPYIGETSTRFFN